MYSYLILYHFYHSYELICKHYSLMNSIENDLKKKIEEERIIDLSSILLNKDVALDSNRWNYINSNTDSTQLPPIMYDIPNNNNHSNNKKTCHKVKWSWFASNEKNSLTAITDKSWEYKEERPGKYGWIANQTNAYLVLPILMSKVCDHILLTYISSYTEEWGIAKLSLSFQSFQNNTNQLISHTIPLLPLIHSKSLLIDGNVTIAKTIKLQFDSEFLLSMNLSDRNVLKCDNQVGNLHVELIQGMKFVIVSIATCDKSHALQSETK